MNSMSSTAKTLAGSDIATARAAPVRANGTVSYFRAVAAGRSAIAAGAISKRPSSMNGTLNCRLSTAATSASRARPSPTR